METSYSLQTEKICLLFGFAASQYLPRKILTFPSANFSPNQSQFVKFSSLLRQKWKTDETFLLIINFNMFTRLLLDLLDSMFSVNTHVDARLENIFKNIFYSTPSTLKKNRFTSFLQPEKKFLR